MSFCLSELRNIDWFVWNLEFYLAIIASNDAISTLSSVWKNMIKVPWMQLSLTWELKC